MVRGASIGLLLMVFLLWAGDCPGEAKDNDDKAFRMEVLEVTAERISEYIKNHSQDVEVVRRKEIVERSLLNIEDVLKTMPGVEVHQSTGVGSRISIRCSGVSTHKGPTQTDSSLDLTPSLPVARIWSAAKNFSEAYEYLKEFMPSFLLSVVT